jgi:hypothetical protein
MLKEYFSALFHGWVGKMSGPASVILAFLPLLWPRLFGQSTILIRAIWIAALICFLIANYSAWKYERDKYEAEVAKNVVPLIKGKITHLQFVGVRTEGVERDEKFYVSSTVSLGVYLCNHNAQETNLQDVILDGSRLSPPVRFGAVTWTSGNPTLQRGKGVSIHQMQSMATIEGYKRVDQVGPIKLDKLKAYAVDGFLNKHPIEVPIDEEMRFHG